MWLYLIEILTGVKNLELSVIVNSMVTLLLIEATFLFFEKSHTSARSFLPEIIMKSYCGRFRIAQKLTFGSVRSIVNFINSESSMCYTVESVHFKSFEDDFHTY